MVLADEAATDHVDEAMSVDVDDESEPASQHVSEPDTAAPLHIAKEPWARQFEEFAADQWGPLERFVSAVVRRRQLAQGAWGPEDIVQLTLIKTAL